MDARRPTIEEYQMMSPEERQTSLEERIVYDLSQADPVFLARATANARRAWEERQQAIDSQA